MAGVGKESREPLKLSPISLLEPGTAAEGPRVQDFFERCTPAALRRDSLQGAWVHTHTSLLTCGPAVRAPQTSGGGLILNCLLCPFFPQGYCVKSRDVQSRGVHPSDLGAQLFRFHPSLSTHMHTHKAGVPHPPPSKGSLAPTQASAQEECPGDVGWRDRERSADRRSGGGWRDEDLGRGPEQPLDQTQTPPLSPFPFPTPRSYHETKEPIATPTPLPSSSCGKERMKERG